MCETQSWKHEKFGAVRSVVASVRDHHYKLHKHFSSLLKSLLLHQQMESQDVGGGGPSMLSMWRPVAQACAVMFET